MADMVMVVMGRDLTIRDFMIFSKYISWYFIFLTLVVSPFVQAKENAMPAKVWEINRATVELHKKRIVKQLARNKLERIGVLCASSAVVLALGWYTFGGMISPAAASGDRTIPENLGKKILEEQQATRNELTGLKHENNYLRKSLTHHIEHCEGYRDGVIAEKDSRIRQLLAQYTGSSTQQFKYKIWGWCKNVASITANNFAVILLMGGLPGPINKMFGFWGRRLEELGARIYHDNDFYWFVSTQTQAVPYFNDLERAAALLPLANDQEEREHQQAAILWSSTVLTKQLARIVSFMELQAQTLKILHTGCSIQMQASAKYMYRHVGQFAKQLQGMLDDPTKHAEIPAYVSTFREQLRSEQDSFCTNERAALFNISDDIK
jgi:hypothetical protein